MQILYLEENNQSLTDHAHQHYMCCQIAAVVTVKFIIISVLPYREPQERKRERERLSILWLAFCPRGTLGRVSHSCYRRYALSQRSLAPRRFTQQSCHYIQYKIFLLFPLFFFCTSLLFYSCFSFDSIFFLIKLSICIAVGEGITRLNSELSFSIFIFFYSAAIAARPSSCFVFVYSVHPAPKNQLFINNAFFCSSAKVLLVTTYLFIPNHNCELHIELHQYC